MKCANCGAEVREGVRFCTECGRPMTGVKSTSRAAAPARAKKPKKEKPPKEPKPKKKIKWGLVAVLAILVALLALAAYAWFTFPSFKMMRALDKGAYTEAAELYADAADSGLQTKLAELTCRGKVSKPAEDFKAGKLSFADAEAFYTVLAEDEDDNALSERAVELLAEIRALQANRDNLAKGDEAFDKGDYETAMAYYGKIPKDAEEYKQAQEKIAACRDQYVADALKTAEDWIKKSNYAEAIRTFEAALAVLPDDAELQDKLDDVSGEYETRTLEKVDSYVSENKYDEAIALLQDVLKVLPDSDKLSDRLDALRLEKPISLNSIATYRDDTVRICEAKDDTNVDVNGVAYQDATLFDASEDAKQSFTLSKKYKSMTGVMFVPKIASDGKEIWIKIYADDKLIWSKEGITNEDGPIPFELDLTGVSVLRIETGNDGSYSHGYLILANTLLKLAG